MNTAKLFVFHPSTVMIEEIDRLIVEIAPGLVHENVVFADLLDRAGESGITAEIRARVRQAVASIPQDPPSVILCSCSTFGACVEEMAPFTRNYVIRIDRPMAEKAIGFGPRIGVAFALKSTAKPTSELLEGVARENSTAVKIQEIFCATAWEHKIRGDNQAYIREVAACIQNSADNLDVIVLAQGSMAPATELLKQLGIPTLSSPRLAIKRVAEICRMLGTEVK